MDSKKFDNDIVCPAIYKWVKGDGPEPYSPVVASLTVLVCSLLRDDRRRRRLECEATAPELAGVADRLDENNEATDAKIVRAAVEWLAMRGGR